MSMTIEQLLKPRYKVIADMPIVKYFQVGEIYPYDIVPVVVGKEEFYVRLDMYPHLFQPLSWWMDRKVEDLPEYVTLEGIVYKVDDWSNYRGGTFYIKSTSGFYRPSFPLKGAIPATLQDYQDFIAKPKKQN